MKVVAITGPSGAGKTTVSEFLAKTNKTFANIDVDHLKHMNPNAFTKVVEENGYVDYPYSAWELLGKNVALLAQSFIDNQLDVIINGYLEEESWREIEKNIKLDNKFLLLPEESINIIRDNSRTDEIKMGEKAVKRGQEYFKNTRYYSDFTLLDTSSKSVEDTVKIIVETIEKNT